MTALTNVVMWFGEVMLWVFGIWLVVAIANAAFGYVVDRIAARRKEKRNGSES